MPNLASVDWMIVLIYLFFIFGVGFSLKPYIASSQDFLLAGRSMPAWICGFAFLSLTASSPLLIAISAAGAQYGLASAEFYLLGAIPPILFLALLHDAALLRSGARSVPEFLGLRFDAKTRTLNACVFALVDHLHRRSFPLCPGVAHAGACTSSTSSSTWNDLVRPGFWSLPSSSPPPSCLSICCSAASLRPCTTR